VGRYSIKDLEELSGIKAHTIRIWEQRYKILCPKRTETNIRYYTDEDIRRFAEH
jgi:MerR family transcriptional regulator, light-induced transcriptional regulator